MPCLSGKRPVEEGVCGFDAVTGEGAEVVGRGWEGTGGDADGFGRVGRVVQGRTGGQYGARYGLGGEERVCDTDAAVGNEDEKSEVRDLHFDGKRERANEENQKASTVAQARSMLKVLSVD